ncbi:MAG TPA: hypothetical protein VHY37_13375 [Tepidisphaeraceae bacterium]|jgi:hypothetical protein|nr:hypothetical protein [Tepidisphaeraceae bacterium]
MNTDAQFRRRIAMAIPIVWILFIATLHWCGVIGRSDARGSMMQPASAPAPSASNSRPAWQANWPGGAPKRNLFRTRLDNFPRDVGTSQQPMRPGDATSGAKSPALPADQNHDATPSGTAGELAQIHLQSTMMHPTPRALVNGQIVGEGDFVGSFRVVRITLSQIVVEKQGVQFTITLK